MRLTPFCCVTSEVKQLKQLVRDVISPGRDLGHVDRHKNHDKALVVAEGQGKEKPEEQEEQEEQKGQEQKGQEESRSGRGKDDCETCEPNT